MQPRTVLQKRVYDLSLNLPALTPKQKEWGYKHNFEHLGYRLKRGTTCLECGAFFQTDKTKCECPSCGMKLIIKDTKKRIRTRRSYYGIITTNKEFQVIRIFLVYQDSRVGHKTKYSETEALQHWISPNGKSITIARLHHIFNYAGWGGDLEIRNYSHMHSINPFTIYPQKQITPTLRRNGFKSNLYDINPRDLFILLLKENRAETLLKTKQHQVLKYVIGRGNIDIMTQYWSSIKICNRNNYSIKDATMWFDYMSLLTYFEKDVHNAKYVCPTDLNRSHDKLVQKRRIAEQKRASEEKRRQAYKDEQTFLALKTRFFGLCFSDSEMDIVFMDNINDYIKEGDILHHCIFVNDYHLREDSLIFSVRIGDDRIATVEFSLKTMKVIQCRGDHNNTPAQSKQIISLVHKNIHLIEKTLAA